METKSLTYAIAATILIRTNFLICATANTDDLQKLPSEPGLFIESETTTSGSDIHPLPWETFTKEVSDLLSPDIFSRANPFTHLLIKVVKLPYDSMNKIHDKISSLLWNRKFPQQYIPYAELVSSIITCLLQLDGVKKTTPFFQNTDQANHLFKPLDISVIDPELSPLFSSYILSDKNPPFRVLIKLLTIPEQNFSSIKIHLRDLFKNRLFLRRYFGFAKGLLRFLEHPHLLQHLKKNIAKVQPAFMDDLLSQKNDNWEDDESSSDSTSTSQHLKQIMPDTPDNSQARDLLQGITVATEVTKFLSPRVFSKSDPVAYFLNIARKLDRFTIRHVNSLFIYDLDYCKFSPEYIPYAELASSLLSCLCELEVVNDNISDIRHNIIRNRSPKQTPVFAFDPELSKLFSTLIVYKASIPSINILKTFIDIPESEISNLANRLKIIQDDVRFPQQYREYNILLRKFLEKNQCLLRIKDDVAEIQRLGMFNSANLNNQQILYLGPR